MKPAFLVEANALSEALASIYLSVTFPGGSYFLYPWVALTCICFSYLPKVSQVIKMRLWLPPFENL